MPNIISSATWEMSAAQLISPTTSQLAVVNAIQTAVAASTNWSVNATGTSTAGFKWLEIKPSNVNSLYKDYRILVVERVNTSTNKSFSANDGGAWNGTSYVYFTFAPDGGAAHVTFTAANIETSSDVYVGSRYKNGASSIWQTIPMPCTALWLYLADGAFWIIDRVSSTSHTLLGLGHVLVSTGYSDYNTAGTEVGVPGCYKKSGIGSVSLNTVMATTPVTFIWTGSGTSARTYTVFTFGWSMQGVPSVSGSGFDWLSGPNNAMTFPPVMMQCQTSGSAGSLSILRGVYWKSNIKTRTTITSSGSTAGFTFYPDDATFGTTLLAIAFMNI